MHCIFQFILCKIPVLDLWQSSPDCILADRAQCPSWSFIRYVEKDFCFLISRSFFSSKEASLTWVLYDDTQFQECNPETNTEWLHTWQIKWRSQQLITKKKSTQKQPVGTTQPRIRDEALPRHPEWQPLSLFQCLVPRELSSLLCQHLQSNKCTCALWIRSCQKKMLRLHLRII